MNCQECQEQLVAYVEGLLEQKRENEISSHLQDCSRCQADVREFRRLHGHLTEQAKELSGKSIVGLVMNRIERKRRLVMLRRKVGFTVAAAAVIAVAITSWILLLTPSGPAYALEQILQANRGVRSIHMQFEPPVGSGVKELWAEFDEFGELLHLRMNFPNTEDGPKDVVWQEDKAAVWFKRKKSYLIVKEKNMLERLKKSAVRFDPKVIVEKLYEKQANGEVQIEIQEPSFENEPITLRVNFNDRPGTWEVYEVDPETKLVTQYERYQLKRGEAKLVERTRYLEYNQPIAPEIFILSPPDDVLRVDETTQVIGLEKGDLTDEQIAVKVVREFFEALIAKDYAKASQFLGGLPASKIEETLGRMNVSRIISIGEPTPHKRTRSLRVPCEIEMEVEESNRRESQAFLEKLYEREKNGKIQIERQEPSAQGEPIVLTVTSDDSTSSPKIYEVDPETNYLLRMREVLKPHVRPVHSQPDRWQIIGGI